MTSYDYNYFFFKIFELKKTFSFKKFFSLSYNRIVLGHKVDAHYIFIYQYYIHGVVYCQQTGFWVFPPKLVHQKV